MKSIITFLLIVSTTISFAQEKFFVIAENGLLCREKPNLDSERIGKLAYGAVVELLEKTSYSIEIKDNGKSKKGNWVKVKYTNFPYIVSTKDDIGYEQEAYVFDGYLEPLIKAKVVIEDMDKSQFNIFQSRNMQKKTTQNKITDIPKIKKMLADKVTWNTMDENGGYYFITSLRLDNGQVLKINEASNDYGVTAYYPKENILMFEGGHTSDFSISIKTGESLNTVGNPEYILASPNNKLRLNGHFPGQECSSYFFQEIKDGKLIYLTDFGWDSIYGKDICNIKSFIWITDNEFAYSYLYYSTQSETEVEKYKKGTIVRIE